MKIKLHHLTKQKRGASVIYLPNQTHHAPVLMPKKFELQNRKVVQLIYPCQPLSFFFFLIKTTHVSHIGVSLYLRCTGNIQTLLIKSKLCTPKTTCEKAPKNI